MTGGRTLRYIPVKIMQRPAVSEPPRRVSAGRARAPPGIPYSGALDRIHSLMARISLRSRAWHGDTDGDLTAPIR